MHIILDKQKVDKEKHTQAKEHTNKHTHMHRDRQENS